MERVQVGVGVDQPRPWWTCLGGRGRVWAWIELSLSLHRLSPTFVACGCRDGSVNGTGSGWSESPGGGKSVYGGREYVVFVMKFVHKGDMQ